MKNLKKYIKLITEDISKESVIKGFIDAISIKDESGFILLESLLYEGDIEALIESNECEDEFFTKIWKELKNKGFRLFAKGTGRLAFVHDKAEGLIFKLVIPHEEELEENLDETRYEKEMMKKHSSLFGSLYDFKANSELQDYFIIVQLSIPLFDTNHKKSVHLKDNVLIEFMNTFPNFKGNKEEFLEFVKIKLVKYYEIANGFESDQYKKVKVPNNPKDPIDLFCEKVIKFSAEIKPDNVGLNYDDKGKIKLVMLDV